MAITFIPARKVPSARHSSDRSLFDAINFDTADLLLISLGCFLLINAFTWLLFWADKRRAIRNEWRISEATLLLLALLGGTIGAFMARKIFRHKTRKQPFVAQLYGVALFQLVFFVVPVGILLLAEHV